MPIQDRLMVGNGDFMLTDQRVVLGTKMSDDNVRVVPSPKDTFGEALKRISWTFRCAATIATTHWFVRTIRQRSVMERGRMWPLSDPATLVRDLEAWRSYHPKPSFFVKKARQRNTLEYGGSDQVTILAIRVTI